MSKRVQFPNGTINILSDVIADRIEAKGQCEILEEDVDPMVNGMPIVETSPADIARENRKESADARRAEATARARAGATKKTPAGASTSAGA